MNYANLMNYKIFYHEKHETPQSSDGAGTKNTRQIFINHLSALKRDTNKTYAMNEVFDRKFYSLHGLVIFKTLAIYLNTLSAVSNSILGTNKKYD